MARYIDAERIDFSPLRDDFDRARAKVIIMGQPTADVVEVKCRCSECKHLKIINKEPVYAECEREKLTFLLWQADIREHFCSHGERRTDDGNL